MTIFGLSSRTAGVPSQPNLPAEVGERGICICEQRTTALCQRLTTNDQRLIQNQKTFTWNVRYLLGFSRIALTSSRVSTSIWLLLLYRAGSLNSIPAEPSPFSRRSESAARLLIVVCSLAANSWSCVILPSAPLPALMRSE